MEQEVGSGPEEQGEEEADELPSDDEELIAVAGE